MRLLSSTCWRCLSHKKYPRCRLSIKRLQVLSTSSASRTSLLVAFPLLTYTSVTSVGILEFNRLVKDSLGFFCGPRFILVFQYFVKFFFYFPSCGRLSSGRGTLFSVMDSHSDNLGSFPPRAGSGSCGFFVRIGPICFLAGCRKRRL